MKIPSFNKGPIRIHSDPSVDEVSDRVSTMFQRAAGRQHSMHYLGDRIKGFPYNRDDVLTSAFVGMLQDGALAYDENHDLLVDEEKLAERVKELLAVEGLSFFIADYTTNPKEEKLPRDINQRLLGAVAISELSAGGVFDISTALPGAIDESSIMPLTNRPHELTDRSVTTFPVLRKVVEAFVKDKRLKSSALFTSVYRDGLGGFDLPSPVTQREALIKAAHNSLNRDLKNDPQATSHVAEVMSRLREDHPLRNKGLQRVPISLYRPSE